METSKLGRISILGCGNIGAAIAKGIAFANLVDTKDIILTKRKIESLSSYQTEGYTITTDTQKAVKDSNIVIICVTPQSLNELLDNIKAAVSDEHILISIVSGAEIVDIKKRLGNEKVSVIRAMPNTAIAFRESMTCIAAENRQSQGLRTTKQIFDALGDTLIVDEHQIVPATALCACGIAFFCRAIRAASQGGIEIGFHSEEALKLAAQTAKGAATLLLQTGHHPEQEVDKVTTPMGCTISGLNCMEHHGFSSAMIKGITHSAEKAAQLYKAKQEKKKEY